MLTAILIGWPLAAAVLAFMIKGEGAKKVAFAASLVQLGLTVFAAAQFQINDKVQFVFNQPWVSSMGINFSLGLDGISLPLVILTNALLPLILLSSFTRNHEKPHTFSFLVLLMQAALVGVFAARDGFLFYIFWELALIPIYFICLIWGGENRNRITFKFFIYTLFGSLFMLVALIFLYLQTPDTHTFAMEALYKAGRELPSYQQSAIFWGMFIAFAIKMPVFPFHTWQPDTYTVAPAQGTMLLSGIMLKMGIFGLIRWLLPVVPQAVDMWGNTAIILAVIGVVYTSVIAIMQNDIKRLVAYSSVAHVGLIAAGVFAGNVQGMQGAMIQMISHGVNVVALFFIIDIIEQRTGTRELERLGGIRAVSPVFGTVFMIVMMGSVALPFTNGFVGEFLLINGVYQYSAWLAAVAGLSVILGAVYMLRGYQKSMMGETSSLTANFAEMGLTEKAVLFPVVLLVIFFGIYPKPLLDISEPAVTSLLNAMQVTTQNVLN